MTDYSRSQMDGERARRLNGAELDYVNGIWDADVEEWIWPSYPDLAAKWDLPIHVINEQAGKHKWVSRRERRKTEMIAFQNESTRKRWLDEDRQIMGILMHNIGRSAQVIGRLHDEQFRMIENAMKEEQDLRNEGEENPVVRCGIRPAEIKELTTATEQAMKTAERLAARIAGLPSVLPEIAPPVLMLTAEQEEQAVAEAAEVENPQTTMLQIFQEMRKIEEARSKAPRIIYDGELDEDDEED